MNSVSYNYDGYTVLVTGGTSLIGKAIVSAFVSSGARVAFTYNHEKHVAEALVKELGEEKTKAFCYDQTETEVSERFLREVSSSFGKVDVLVNNSGLHGHTATGEISEEEWNRITGCNLKGVFFLSRDFAEMTAGEGRKGSVVSLSSINSTRPLRNATHYSISKAGVDQMTRSMAEEYGRKGIRFNAVAPGLIDSPTIDTFCPGWKERFEGRAPLRRVGKPEDVANLVLFLSSEGAGWITGQVIILDGGITLASAY